jgi:hypothetical protein
MTHQNRCIEVAYLQQFSFQSVTSRQQNIDMSETADKILQRYCEDLLQNQPKIDQALKNLISLNISTYQTANHIQTFDPAYIQSVMATIR